MKPINTVAVMGLGTMGHGIAQAFAAAGCQVRGYDYHQEASASLHERIRRNLDDFVTAGLARKASVEPLLKRITVHETEAEAVRGAQFVTEAVEEDLAMKQAWFARLEEMVPAHTILASNSSTFPISQSGANLEHPERAIVTHWFNPPHIVPTVEVVPGPLTSVRTTNNTMAFLKRAGKEAIHIRQELPGFIVNRVQVAVMREVWDLYSRGVASPEEIDAAIRGSMGFRLAAIGPLLVNDFGGLDLQMKVFNNLAPQIQSGTEVPEKIKKLVAAGHYGAKTHIGIYNYTRKSLAATRSERDRRFLELLKLFYSRQRESGKDD